MRQGELIKEIASTELHQEGRWRKPPPHPKMYDLYARVAAIERNTFKTEQNNQILETY